MNIVNPYRYNANINTEPNVFIGGIGGTYSTAALVAAEFNFSESDISNFNIDDDNNVSFRIETDYTTTNDTFRNDSTITYFIDAEGFFKDASNFYAFAGNSNLTHFYAAGMTGDIGFIGAQGQFLLNANSLERASFENGADFDGRNNLKNCTALEKLDLRSAENFNLLNVAYKSLEGLTSLKYLYIGAGTTMNFDYAHINQRLLNLSSSCKIYYNTAFGVQDRNPWSIIKWTNNGGLGDWVTINGLTYTAVASASSDGEFEIEPLLSNTVNNLKTAINNDTRTGTLGTVLAKIYSINGNNDVNLGLYGSVVGVAGESITSSINANATGIFIKGSTTSFIGGNDVHFTLMYARDDEGATLIEVDNIVTVNATTGLSASSIASTSFTLNFTEPTANANGTEIYEVWVEETNNKANPKNYFYYQYVSGTGISITGLEPNTEYIVKVRTQDGQMQFSNFSSSISLTTL